MFGLSASHLIVLGIVVLLFGSRRLPELGASMGAAIRAFKAATDGQSALNEQQNRVALSQSTPKPEPVVPEKEVPPKT